MTLSSDGLDGAQQVGAAFHVGVAIVIFRFQQLDADPEQQQGPHHLEEGQGQELQGKEDEDDA